MPQLIPAIPGILLNFAIGTAVNVGVGLVSNALSGSAQSASRGVQFEARAGISEPVRVIFGEYATGGRFWHQNSYGDDNEYLQLVYECGRTEYQGLTGLLLDGKPCTLSGSNADAKGRVIDELKKGSTPYGWVKYYTGAAGQVADPELVARANPASRWPTTKTMTGTAYAIITLRYSDEVFEGGLPDWTFIWRGAKLYDRRKDSTMPGGSGAHRWGQPETYEWTANPAIILDNFRKGLWINGVRVLGAGVTEAACHHARIVAAANICDELVTFDDTGRTLPRYSFGAEISDAEDQMSVQRMLETAMAGFGAEFGGAYAPLPAQTLTSLLTLTDGDRVAGEDVTERTRLDPTDIKTAYGGVFVSPADGYAEKEYGLRFDADVEEAEGGRRQGPLNLQYVQAQETAGMIAEIFRRRDLYSATETAIYGPKAAKLEPGDVITRVSDLLGTVPMMVTSVKELSGARFQLTLRRWDNSIVPDPTEGFLPITPDPVPAPVPSRPITVPAFTAVAATQVSGDQTVPAIKIGWTPITDATVDRVIVKYWRDGAPDDARYLSIDEPGAGVAVIEGVVPLADYVLVATIATTPPRPTIWTAERTVTTGALSVATVPGAASVDWDALAGDVKDQLSWITGDIRTLVAGFQRLGTILEEADLDQFTQRQKLARQVGVRLDSVEASFVEVIETAFGPGGAIATALSSLYAAFGGNDAAVNVRWQAVAAPAGYSARYAIQAAVNDGTFRAASFMLDVPANPAEKTRIVLDANQVVFTDSFGAALPAVAIEGGELKFVGARAGRISSADGTTMFVDFDTPEIYMEGV